MKYLEHHDRNVRKAAGYALGQLGKHAESTVPTLTMYLEHKRRSMREAAAYALGQLGKHAAACLHAVTDDGFSVYEDMTYC